MLGFLAGAAAGYVLGARAGRQRYERIRSLAAQAWASQPVQSGLQQAGHKVRTQALPYLADRAGDAVKAAGQRARARGGQDARPATVRRDLNGTAYADVVSSRSVR